MTDQLADIRAEGLILLYWLLQQLKGRVLVKGKKLPAARSEDGRILSDREEEEEEEEEEGVEAAEQRRWVSGLAWGLGITVELGEGKGARRTRGWSWRAPARLVFPGQADLPGTVSPGRVLLCHPPTDPAPCPCPAPALPGQLPQRAQSQEVHPGGR